MKKDINNSIKELDFEALSVCLGKVKFAKRVEYNYEMTQKHILNIDLNEKVQKIIENEKIPVEIHYKYNKKEKEFYIEKKPNLLQQLNYLSYSNKEEKSKLNSPSNSIALSIKEGNKKETSNNKDNSILSLQKYLNYSKQNIKI